MNSDYFSKCTLIDENDLNFVNGAGVKGALAGALVGISTISLVEAMSGELSNLKRAFIMGGSIFALSSIEDMFITEGNFFTGYYKCLFGGEKCSYVDEDPDDIYYRDLYL